MLRLSLSNSGLIYPTLLLLALHCRLGIQENEDISANGSSGFQVNFYPSSDDGTDDELLAQSGTFSIISGGTLTTSAFFSTSISTESFLKTTFTSLSSRSASTSSSSASFKYSITTQTASQTSTQTISPPAPSSEKRLSAVAITGIVLGTLVILAISVLGLTLLYGGRNALLQRSSWTNRLGCIERI